MADSLSIEATNKVRASLGLPLLPVPGGTGVTNKDAETSESEDDDPGSTLESRQAEGYDNWTNLQKDAIEKKKRQARLDAIKKARDEAQRTSKLQGKSLGEADEDEDISARAWLKGAAKRQKSVDKKRKQAEKIERELREREENEYTSRDLAGLRVAHQTKDFDLENGDQILTLKDATIEENEEEGDELENIELAEKERLEERLDSKKKKPRYNPMDDVDGESNMLQQYDEVIDGKKRKHFTLNGTGDIDQDEEMADTLTFGKASKVISLDILKELPSSDYQEPKEVKMKKIKKGKSKNIRQRQIDNDDIGVSMDGMANGDQMEVDIAPRPTKRIKDDTFDDDDLQLSLARQRRAAFKQRKKMRPDDLADQIRQEETNAADTVVEDGGLVIDETSEFISNLQLPEPNRTVKSQTGPKAEESPADSPTNSDHASPPDSHKEPETEAPEDTEILGPEATVNSMAGALNLARDRGLLNSQKDNGNANESVRGKTFILNEKAKIARQVDEWAQRERERRRNTAEWKRMSIQERENLHAQINKERDRRRSELENQLMQNYRPDVQLRYTDENGRDMDVKETWKQISHAFHGKTPGKQKTEKHLKKIEEEKQRKQKSII